MSGSKWDSQPRASRGRHDYTAADALPLQCAAIRAEFAAQPPARQREYAAARGLAAWALRETYRGLSVQQIAALLGYRDHTTVLYHITRVAARMSADTAYAATARALVPHRYTLIMRPVVVEE